MSEFVHTSLATTHHGWPMAWIWGSCTYTSGVYLSFRFPFMYSRFYLYSATLWQKFLPPLARNLLVSCKRLPCTTASYGTNVAAQPAIFQTNRVLPSIRQLPMDLRICHILIELIDNTTVRLVSSSSSAPSDRSLAHPRANDHCCIAGVASAKKHFGSGFNCLLFLTVLLPKNCFRRLLNVVSAKIASPHKVTCLS